MPELPEVETVRRGLKPVLVGRRLLRVMVRRPDLRTPFPADFARRLEGRVVTAVERRAKYLLIRLDDAQVLIIHLGMTGRFDIVHGVPPPAGPHDHVDLTVEGATTARFHDPRRFGSMDLTTTADLPAHPGLAKLGPEPLDRAFTGRALAARLAGRAGPLKTVLLDQGVVAGLGNIYVSESLFKAGLSPLRQARSVTGAAADRLVSAIKTVLRAAIRAGGSTLRDYRRANGELGMFQHRFAVYDREGLPCPGCDCKKGIKRLVQAGRATFYCARRQG